MAWTGTIGVRGANGKVSNLNYNLNVTAVLPADQYSEAVSLLDDIATPLAVVTDGTIAFKRVSNAYAEDSAAGGGDVFEKATLSVHIGQTGQAEKFATINIPAPVIGVFMATTGTGRDVVDVSNGDLQDYVDAVANSALVSDGETINTALGANGMDSGRRTLARVKLGK